jgi:hypothetical protein
VTFALWSVVPLAGLMLSPLVYGVALLGLHPFGPEEWMRIAPLVPERLRRWLGPRGMLPVRPETGE